MTSKSPDKRVLSKTAKRVGISKNKKTVTLKEQYSIIRDDLLRLRDDIAKGYSLTKDWIDKRGNMREILLKAK